MSIILALWSNRKVVAYIAVAAFLCILFWRIQKWHEAYAELQVVSQALDNEKACKPNTSCSSRFDKLVLDGQTALVQAVAAEKEKEDKARADQSKREDEQKKAHQKALADIKQQLDDANARLVHAVSSDQSCRTWYSSPIRCPIS